MASRFVCIDPRDGFPHISGWQRHCRLGMEGTFVQECCSVARSEQRNHSACSAESWSCHWSVNRALMVWTPQVLGFSAVTRILSLRCSRTGLLLLSKLITQKQKVTLSYTNSWEKCSHSNSFNVHFFHQYAIWHLKLMLELNKQFWYNARVDGQQRSHSAQRFVKQHYVAKEETLFLLNYFPVC